MKQDGIQVSKQNIRKAYIVLRNIENLQKVKLSQQQLKQFIKGLEEEKRTLQQKSRRDQSSNGGGGGGERSSGSGQR